MQSSLKELQATSPKSIEREFRNRIYFLLGSYPSKYHGGLVAAIPLEPTKSE